MPTTITGPVRMPDGTIPTHGRVIFTRLKPLAGERIVTTAPVEANVGTDGTITVALEGEAVGTRYGALVEQWSNVEGRLVNVALPDVVVTGSGSGPIGTFATIPVPRADTYELFRGDTFSSVVTVTDGNDRPADITDSTVTAWIEAAGTVTPISAVKLTPAAGEVQITISAAVSAALPLGQHIIVIQFAVGTQTNSLRGKIKII